MTDYFKWGNFFYDTFGAPWHDKDDKINKILRGMTVTDAIDATGMSKIQVVLADDVSKVWTPEGFIEVPALKQSLWLTNVPWTDNGVQDLNRKVEWYTPIQNAAYGEVLNPLCKSYQVSSAFHCGPLGETVVFQFEMPEFLVAGLEQERHQCFLTIAENRHNGKKFFFVTSVRVVCQNTFNQAVNRGVRSLPNSSSPELMIAFQVALEEHRISQVVALNNFFTTKATKEDVIAVANALFPMPKLGKVVDKVQKAEDSGYDMANPTPANLHLKDKTKLAQENYQRHLARQEKHMMEFFTRFDRFNDEFPYAGHTKYALFQAGTEHMGKTEHFHSPNDVREYNLLFGTQNEALERAWAVLSK